MSPPGDFAVQQEEDRVESRRIVRVGVVSLLVGAIAVFFAGLLEVSSVGALRPTIAPRRGPRTAPREIGQVEQTPILETRAGIDMQRAQAGSLAGWGWVDRDAGIATIPIEEAMDIVARESP
jgi:hypothetical protein